ncbi:MAG: septum formation initiator family protein [Candidatus Paceibacterota bacterium]|jgi:cell division protein FtsB
MKENQPKKKHHFSIYSKPFLIFLAVVVVLLLKGTWGVWQKERESKRNVAEVSQELIQLSKRKDLLQGQIQKLNTEEGIEESLRQKFQISKEGEKVLVVVDRAPTTTQSQNTNIFQRIWSGVSSVFKKK